MAVPEVSAIFSLLKGFFGGEVGQIEGLRTENVVQRADCKAH